LISQSKAWLPLLLLACLCTLVTTVETAAAEPRHITLATHTLKPGSRVAFGGAGWAPGTALQLQLCGRKALNGSADCASNAASTASADDRGRVDGVLIVTMPPRPCPCVVLAQSTTGFYSTSIPVTVVGAKTKPVAVAAPVPVNVNAAVAGGWSWRSLFGMSADRELQVRITNMSKRAVAFPLVSAGWGRSGHTDNVVPGPPPAALPPGKSTMVRMPFTLGPLSMGQFDLQGNVAGSGPLVEFSSSTTTTPWGLIAIVGLCVHFVVLKVRNRVRRAHTRTRKTPAHRLEDAPLLEELVG
jgi:hypothetical protein